MVTLYDWQEECLNKWKEVSYRGLIEVTTGSGKTLLAAVAAKRRREETNFTLKIYIIVPRIPLLEQWKKTLEYVGLGNAVIQNMTQIIPSEISIFTINRARDKLPLLIEQDMKENKKVLLILDEFHHYGSPANYHLFDFMLSPYYKQSLYSSLGLSATADVSTLKSKLIPAIGPLFYKYELNFALQDKVVNDFVLFNIAIELNKEEREEYDDLTDRITKLFGVLHREAPNLTVKKMPIEELILRIHETKNQKLIDLANGLKSLLLERRTIIATANSRIKTIPEILKTLREDDKILIFTERILQVEDLYFLLSQKGYKCARYTSAMDKYERSRNLTAFKEGEISILITCKALDEGLDVPDCNVGIFLANTATKLQRIQRSGRIIRKRKNKLPSVLYYLFCDDTVETPSFLSTLPENLAVANTKVINSGEIFNPQYYERVLVLLEKLKKEKTSEKHKYEILSFIKYGNIRPEQFKAKDELITLRNKSKEPFFRSYLSFMILLVTVAPEKSTIAT
jgi:superfamily II DNA or RNA helicase